MSEVAELEATPARPGLKAKVLTVAMLLALAGAGFATTFLGYLDPITLMKKEKVEGADKAPAFVFIDVPQIVLTLAGQRPRTLVLSTKIEANASQAEDIEYLLPRISDSFNLFLSEVDPIAFERRGILDIVRSELATRLSYILGPDSFRELLITEFRIQ